MNVINLFCETKQSRIEVKCAFRVRRAVFNYYHHELLQLGFKWNKLRRTYNKVYFQNQYAVERFDPDMEALKTLFFGKFECNTYKLLDKEVG